MRVRTVTPEPTHGEYILSATTNVAVSHAAGSERVSEVDPLVWEDVGVDVGTYPVFDAVALNTGWEEDDGTFVTVVVDSDDVAIC